MIISISYCSILNNLSIFKFNSIYGTININSKTSNSKDIEKVPKFRIKYNLYIFFLSLFCFILNVITFNFKIIISNEKPDQLIHLQFIIKHFLIPIIMLSLFIFLTHKYVRYENKKLNFLHLIKILLISYLIKTVIMILILVSSDLSTENLSDEYESGDHSDKDDEKKLEQGIFLLKIQAPNIDKKKNEDKKQEDNELNEKKELSILESSLCILKIAFSNLSKINSYEDLSKLIQKSLRNTKFFVACYNDIELMLVTFFFIISFMLFYIIFKTVSSVFENT